MAGISSPYEPISLDKEIMWRFWDELEGVKKKQQSKRLIYVVMHYVINIILLIMQIYVHYDVYHGFNGFGLCIHKSDVVCVPS